MASESSSAIGICQLPDLCKGQGSHKQKVDFRGTIQEDNAERINSASKGERLWTTTIANRRCHFKRLVRPA
eukprot:688909-Prorocentrum_minimum.AAC.3